MTERDYDKRAKSAAMAMRDRLLMTCMQARRDFEALRAEVHGYRDEEMSSDDEHRWWHGLASSGYPIIMASCGLKLADKVEELVRQVWGTTDDDLDPDRGETR